MTTRSGKVLPSYYLLILVLLYIPLGVLFLFSLNDGTALSFPLQGLSLDWYRAMLDNTLLLAAVRNSAIVALVAGVLATLLGTLAAMGLVRLRFRGRSLLLAVALMPLLVPFLILGVALLILFSAAGVGRSLVTVALAHTVVAIPYTLLIMMARLVGFDRAVEEAAADLGASYVYTLRRVVMPMIAPAMLAAFLVAFTISFDEFVLASFTVGSEPTFPVFIFGQLRFANRFPEVVALASLVMVASVGLVVVAERLQKVNTGRAKASGGPGEKVAS
ncbi:MAG TPA: ABC transporter permease [Acidimicrobiia bacterium]|nr:ABC transporter permease [Acidimicrobiia bacterium]